MDPDVLQPIPDEYLPKLKSIYEKHSPYGDHVCYLLHTAIEWKRKRPDKKYLSFFAPRDGLKSDSSGTFVLVMVFGVIYHLFVSTLEPNGESLFKALTESKLIKWPKGLRICIVLNDQVPVVVKALNQLNLKSYHVVNTVQWISKEEARNFKVDCPNDVYLDKLDRSHASLINALWPHKCEGSVEYVETLIELNNGFGIFVRRDDALAAWILKTQLGGIGILQTADEHKRKGYGRLVTKAVCREIAEEGYSAVGTIVVGNEESERLFRSLGFKNLGLCTYIVLQ